MTTERQALPAPGPAIHLRHLFGGIGGGMAFGVLAGLLLGSCVFEAGPNHRAVASRGAESSAMPPPQAPTEVPGGMDPGSGQMEAIFTRINSLKQTVTANPGDLASLIELGNLYYDANKFDQAVVWYDRALALDRMNPNVLTDAGFSHMQVGNLARAEEYFKEAQARYPQHWQSAVNLFVLAAQKGDATLAGEALASVRRANPGFDRLPDLDRAHKELLARTGG